MSRTELLCSYYQKHQAGCDSDTLIKLRNQIAIVNKGLILKAARKMQRRCNLEFEDLYHFAFIGMLKAIPKYNPTQGAAFSSFVMPYLEGEIQHHLRDRQSLIKVPRRWREKRDEAQSIQRKLASQGRSLIDLDEVAQKGLGIDARTWQTIAHATQYHAPASLDDEDAIQISDPTVQSLEEAEEKERIQAAVRVAVDRLPSPNREVLIEKFWGELSDAVIAHRHHTTVSQLQILISESLAQLRSLKNAND